MGFVNQAEAARSYSIPRKDWLVLCNLALFGLITAVCPTVRAFYHFEINYVDGWNVYNALKVAEHIPLYGAKYAWTTVNYPAHSFYIVAYLSRFTHGYLLAGRLLSLFSLGISCVLIGLIIRKLTSDFGEVFFLSGLLLYVAAPPTLGRLALIAVLFIVGGNIKHNLLEFPLAVFIDLCIASRRKATAFALFSAVLLCASIALNIKYGGPYFIANLLSPREYSVFGGIIDFLANYWPILLPFVASCIWVKKNWRDGTRQLICIFFIVSLLLDVSAAGGVGVSINAYFGNFLASSIIMGMILHDAWQSSAIFFISNPLWRRRVPVILFASLSLPFALSGYFLFWDGLKKMPEQQKKFDEETSFLRAQPSPVICESLLRCYYAGKTQVFEPFNSTRLVRFHKLDSAEIVQNIATHQYGAIQLDGRVESFERPNERFPSDVLDAIRQDYVISVDDPGCAIYIPKNRR